MSARGAHDLLDEIVADLREYQPLVELLPEPEAIYAGFPAENRGYQASVTITSVTDNETPHRGVMEREYRVQATVTATRGWREWYDYRDDQPSSISQMDRILSEVGQRLNRAQASDGTEIPRGGEGGPQPMEMEDERMAITGDWLLAGWYLE